MSSVRFSFRAFLVCVSLLLAAGMLSACMPVQPVAVAAQSATDNTAAVDMDAVVNDIWREYEASVEAGDADRWGELWVEDGVKYPPDSPVLDGKEAIVNNMRDWMEMATANDVAISNHDVQVVGDFAFVRGLFRVDAELKASGMPIVMDGKYMSIVQRQADGSWKLYRDIFNSNAPPAAAAAQPVQEADMEAVINHIWEEYAASTATDADRYVALWADDGVQLPNGRPPVVGIDAIYARKVAGVEAMADVDFEMTIVNEEYEVLGDVAWCRGSYSYRETPKAGGETTEFEGKYMSILHKQADGTWKLYRDISNANSK